MKWSEAVPNPITIRMMARFKNISQPDRWIRRARGVVMLNALCKVARESTKLSPYCLSNLGDRLSRKSVTRSTERNKVG